MTPEEYFKKWSEHCRLFTDYKPLHSHEDMMRFAKDYHEEQLLIQRVSKSFYCQAQKYDGKECCNEQCITCFSKDCI